jgi:hypothetical protein
LKLQVPSVRSILSAACHGRRYGCGSDAEFPISICQDLSSQRSITASRCSKTRTKEASPFSHLFSPSKLRFVVTGYSVSHLNQVPPDHLARTSASRFPSSHGVTTSNIYAARKVHTRKVNKSRIVRDDERAASAERVAVSHLIRNRRSRRACHHVSRSVRMTQAAARKA